MVQGTSYADASKITRVSVFKQLEKAIVKEVYKGAEVKLQFSGIHFKGVVPCVSFKIIKDIPKPATVSVFLP